MDTGEKSEHFILLPKWKWKLLSQVWLSATPWTIQSMEFSRQEYWSGLPFPFPGELPNLGIKPRSPALWTDSLLSELPGKPFVQLFVTPWTIQPMEFSWPEYWSGSLSLLQGIFPTQGSNPSLPHCKSILYKLSHKPDSIPGLGISHTEGNKEYFLS